MGKYRRLGKNTLLMFLGNIGSKSLSFLMLPFYTSFLSVADYGTVDLIQVYVQLLVGLCTCTLTEAIFVFPKGRTFVMQQTYFTSGLLFSAGTLALTGVLFAVVVLALRAVSYEGIFTEYNLCIFLMLRHFLPELHPAVRPQHREGKRLRRLRGGPHPDHRAHLVGDPAPVGASWLHLLHHCLLLRGLPLLRGGCPGTHLFLPCPVVVAKAEGNAALLHPDDAQQHHVVGVQQHESPHFGALFGDRGHRHLCRGKQVPPAYKYVVYRLHLLLADFRPRRVREARLPRVL